MRGRGVSTTMITKSHHQYSSPYNTNHQDQDQYMSGGGGGGGGGWGLSWPPRFYSCNFCKREFRSAQALGGHMNVHRRDRARLRSAQLSPNFNLNLIPSPNPNPTAPSPSTRAFSTTHQNHLLPKYQVGPTIISPQCASIYNPKKLLVMRRPRSLSAKGRGAVKLGLEIGIFDDKEGDEDDDEEEGDVEVGLDLELRLGYKH